MKNKRIIFAFILIIMLILIGCTNKNAVDKEEPSNNKENNQTEEKEIENPEDAVLRVAINAQPPTIDPLISTATISRDIALQIFEPLITINSGLQPEPMLAESYEVSEDGKTITFELRQGVKFHNGQEMTAEDVVASMERWQGISSRAKAAFSNSTFKADGDYTVILEMDKPNSTALPVLSSSTQMPAIMPKEIAEAAGDQPVTEFIGTGPFQFVEWKQDQYIKLEKYDDYVSSADPADGPAGKREALVDEILFMIATDSSTRLAGIKSGEYDIATTIPFNNFDQIESDSNVNAYMEPSGFNIIVFNKKEGPFADQKIRQAVAATLDMEAILQASFSDEQFYEMNAGIMLKQQADWYTDAGKENYNQKDPEKGKALLEEAGYKGEEVTFITSREYEDFYNASVVIKEQLEAIGMKVNLEVFDWATVVESQGEPSAYDAFITGFGINTDPTQLLFLNSKNEWAGWTESDKIDQLIEDIRASSTQEEAKSIYEELQLEIWDYLPILKLGDKNFLYAVNKNVEGFQDVIGMVLWNVKKSSN